MKRIISALFTVVILLCFCPVAVRAQICPECVEVKASGYTAVLTFDHTGKGLCLSEGETPAGFELYSLGRWVKPDSAEISGDDVVTLFFSDSWSMVRYHGGNLCSSDGIPASGFTRQPEGNKSDGYINAEVISNGEDIYTPVSLASSFRYQYGASAIVNPDGSIDVWTSSHGTSAAGLRVLDYIGYLHSDDGGATWSDRKIVLSPTAVSMDHHSCCDPGVIYFGGYYYLGYTSTLDHSGYANNIFVARSTTPDGPFEKWNGNGWGGDPAPIITFEDYSNHWGAGEVSFVELNGCLYIYYSLREWTNAEGYVNKTMAATADASDANWPSSIRTWGSAAVRSGSPSGADVKYHEPSGKFIMMGMENAMSPSSGIFVYQSDDGLSFTQCDALYDNVYYYAHNNGMSGNRSGHIADGDQAFITYAYGTGTANWATRLSPVEFKLADFPDASDSPDNLIKENHGERSESFTMGITAENRSYVRHVSDGTFTVPVLKFSNVMGRSEIADSGNVVFSGYDSSVVTFDGCNCTPVGPGETEALISYRGFHNTVKIIVRPEGVSTEHDTLISFVPQQDELNIELGTPAQPQIKGIGVSYAGKIAELFNDPSASSYDFNSETHTVSYTGYDNSLISISDQGIIVPYAEGSTMVTVTCDSSDPVHNVSNSRSFVVLVNVVKPKKNTLTLDPSGGFISGTEKYLFADGQSIYDIFPCGLPVPVKAGYLFTGWADSETGEELSLEDECPSGADLVCNATWAPEETYTLSFDANGGDNAPAAQKKMIGETLVITGDTPRRDGYEFTGWSLESTGAAPDFLSGGEYDSDSDAVLYAVWRHTAHVWSRWTTDVEAGIEKEGHKFRTCGVCGEKQEKFLPAIKTGNPFSDIPDGKWFTSGVLDCYRLGYMTGTSDTCFSPDAEFTRAMFVTVLARVDCTDTSDYSGSHFTDVPEGKWYSAAVEWAFREGYASGTGNGRFSPSVPVTRETMAQFLFTYSLKNGYDVSGRADLDVYIDSQSVSAWAKNAVSWAVCEGLISGTSETRLSPKIAATRAQTAVIINNFSSKTIK